VISHFSSLLILSLLLKSKNLVYTKNYSEIAAILAQRAASNPSGGQAEEEEDEEEEEEEEEGPEDFVDTKRPIQHEKVKMERPELSGSQGLKFTRRPETTLSDKERRGEFQPPAKSSLSLHQLLLGRRPRQMLSLLLCLLLGGSAFWMWKRRR
jgi:hypothetical protein